MKDRKPHFSHILSQDQVHDLRRASTVFSTASSSGSTTDSSSRSESSFKNIFVRNIFSGVFLQLQAHHPCQASPHHRHLVGLSSSSSSRQDA
mmetsp:Transcript_30705/g.74364  ORF Transcript_30705/g.74364 Transcript_30705/m.74364 type:complete len:92 (+) Transcript_30705:533-808(+)